MCSSDLDVAKAEDIADQSICAAVRDVVAVTRDDTRRILSTMLQNQQSVIQSLAHLGVRMPDKADDSAHRVSCLPERRGT